MRFKLTRKSECWDDINTMMITVEPKTVDDIMTIVDSFGPVTIHPSLDLRNWGGEVTFPEIEIYDE